MKRRDMGVRFTFKVLSASILICVILVLLLSPVGNAFSHRSVLVLNSYNRGLDWTDQQTQGIIETIRKNSADTAVSVEYLDWKNDPNLMQLEKLADLFRSKYARKPISLIITTDDAALEFALKYRKELFGDAPIVFSGVQEEAANRILLGQRNVTGIHEEIDAEKTLKVMLDFNPNLNRLYLIHDNTESGLITSIPVKRAVQKLKPELEIVYLNNLSYYDVRAQLHTALPDSAALITSYSRDVHSVSLELERYVALFSETSRIPVYIVYEFETGYGAVGGSVLDARSVGKSAALLGIRILSGEKADELPRLRTTDQEYVFDYKELQRFNLPLDKLPPGSRVINHPDTFYDQYKNIIWTVLTLFVLMVIYIASLIENVKKRQAAEENLYRSNEELTALNEEMLASQEELQAQYEQLMATQDALVESEERHSYLAFHDTLTGLPNRSALNRKLTELLTDSERQDIRSGAMVLFDLDNFKVINDTFGHSYGDKLLVVIGSILKENTAKGQFVARMGGDEFAIVLEQPEGRSNVTIWVESLISLFREPISLEGKTFYITLSVGISLFPEDGSELEQLIRNADLALYKAKALGKNRYAFFETAMGETVQRKALMERKLREAISNHELQLWYQPLIDVRTGKITGFEALLRWENRKNEIIMPGEFIQLAEETGLIIPIGYWVIKEACQFIKSLHEDGYDTLTVAVNISVAQLMQANFAEEVRNIVTRVGIPIGSLGLEITESVLMESMETNIRKLRMLRKLGLVIYLDDFGTGYSSLKYLQYLPIDVVKIDKSFIDGIADEADKDLTGSIISLIHRLGLTAAAEGVEKERQFLKLREYGCDAAQGYLFSKPVPGNQVRELLIAYGYFE